MMKFNLCVTVTTIILFCSNTSSMTNNTMSVVGNSSDKGRKDDDDETAPSIIRIVGGYPCQIQEHPYMVSIHLTVNFHHHCGGSAISEFWILTAAHCSIRNYQPGVFTVYAGTSLMLGNVRIRGHTIQKSLVDKVYVHENFRAFTFPAINDIALMLLDYPLRETPSVRFIKLPKSLLGSGKDILDVCKNCTVMGWGVQYITNEYGTPLLKPTRPHDDHLRCIHLPTMSNKECQKLYNLYIPDTILCAYRNHEDACQGDSGGPLVCNGLQFGIVSSGYGCAYKEFPGLYTRVDKYEDFIYKVLTRSKCCYRKLTLSALFLLLVFYFI